MLFVAGLLVSIPLCLAKEECGRHSWRFFERENYVSGGRNVQYADSVVSVQVFKSDELWNDLEWKHICGGVLLNKRWVLTAAHCIKEIREWGTSRVVLGSTKINGTNHQEIPVRRMFEHPEWTPITRTNDVALIELKTEVSSNYAVSPACVNSNLNDVIEYESCVALGWGKANESSGFSEDLKAVSLNVLTYPQCTRAYRNMNGVRISRKFHICAGRMGERGRGICQGDLGGPLFCRTSAREHVELVGIATNGAACGSPQHPGIFIRLDSFISWIRETSNDQSIGDANTDWEITTEPATDKPLTDPTDTPRTDPTDNPVTDATNNPVTDATTDDPDNKKDGDGNTTDDTDNTKDGDGGNTNTNDDPDNTKDGDGGNTNTNDDPDNKKDGDGGNTNDDPDNKKDGDGNTTDEPDNKKDGDGGNTIDDPDNEKDGDGGNTTDDPDNKKDGDGNTNDDPDKKDASIDII